MDAQGRIVFWNRAAETILGYRAREVVGRGCCEIFTGPGDDEPHVCPPRCSLIPRADRGETVHSFDMPTRAKGGRMVWLSISSLVRETSGGRPVGVHLFQDVTTIRELLALVQERFPPAGNGTAAASSSGGGALTRRELEVLRLMAEGLNTGAAAERLQVSGATVRNHAQSILSKLGVHSRLEAVAHATRLRLL